MNIFEFLKGAIKWFKNCFRFQWVLASHHLGLPTASEVRKLAPEEVLDYTDVHELLKEGIREIAPYIIETSIQGDCSTSVVLNNAKFCLVKYAIEKYLEYNGYSVKVQDTNVLGEDVIEFKVSW